MEEWRELKFDRRWGSGAFDKQAKQQIAISEFNVFLGLRQRTFLSPRLHRALCRLSTLQPSVMEKAWRQAGIHALMNEGAVYKPVTVFLIDVPKGLKAQLCVLRGTRKFKTLLDDQTKELTMFVNDKLEGVTAEHIYCVAQLFKQNRRATFKAYKLSHVTANEKEAFQNAKINFNAIRQTYVLEITRDHDIIMTRIREGVEDPSIIQEANMEKEAALQAYNAVNGLQMELKMFSPDFEKVDRLLATIKNTMNQFESVRKAYSDKYAVLKSEFDRRRTGFVTRADLEETNKLLRKILEKLRNNKKEKQG